MGQRRPFQGQPSPPTFAKFCQLDPSPGIPSSMLISSSPGISHALGPSQVCLR